jgi:hypothetical protein
MDPPTLLETQRLEKQQEIAALEHEVKRNEPSFDNLGWPVDRLRPTTPVADLMKQIALRQRELGAISRDLTAEYVRDLKERRDLRAARELKEANEAKEKKKGKDAWKYRENPMYDPEMNYWKGIN